MTLPFVYIGCDGIERQIASRDEVIRAIHSGDLVAASPLRGIDSHRWEPADHRADIAMLFPSDRVPARQAKPPPAPLPWWHLWFSLRGRATRLDYWVGWVLPLVAVYAAMFWLMTSGSGSPWLLVVVPLALLWSTFAVTAKRCHDLGRSWWFLAIWWVIPSLLQMLAALHSAFPPVVVFLAFLALIGWLWGTVELGFLRGTVGANAYGDDPLGGTVTGAVPPRIRLGQCAAIIGVVIVGSTVLHTGQNIYYASHQPPALDYSSLKPVPPKPSAEDFLGARPVPPPGFTLDPPKPASRPLSDAEVFGTTAVPTPNPFDQFDPPKETTAPKPVDPHRRVVCFSGWDDQGLATKSQSKTVAECAKMGGQWQ